MLVYQRVLWEYGEICFRILRQAHEHRQGDDMPKKPFRSDVGIDQNPDTLLFTAKQKSWKLWCSTHPHISTILYSWYDAVACFSIMFDAQKSKCLMVKSNV